MSKEELDELNHMLRETHRERVCSLAADALQSLRAENERMQAVCEAVRRFLDSENDDPECRAVMDMTEALAMLDAGEVIDTPK